MKSSTLTEGLWALWPLSLLGVDHAGGTSRGACFGGTVPLMRFRNGATSSSEEESSSSLFLTGLPSLSYFFTGDRMMLRRL